LKILKCQIWLENYTFISACVHKTCRLFRTILHSLCYVSCTCSCHDVCPPSPIMDSEVETSFLLLQLHKTGSLTAFHFFKPGLCVLTPFIYDFLQFFLHFFWLLTDGKPQVLSAVVEASRHVFASCDISLAFTFFFLVGKEPQAYHFLISSSFRYNKQT
jgi:hypothetical protein